MEQHECPICKSGAFGLKWTRDFHVRNDVTAGDIAIHYDISVEDVLDHIKNHEVVTRSISDNKIQIKSMDFYLTEMGRIYEALDDAFSVITLDKEYDSVKIDQMTKLTKEMSSFLTKMAEMQGRLKTPGDSEKKVLKVEGDLNLITDIVSGGCLCPECQQKVMKKLEKVEKMLN